MVQNQADPSPPQREWTLTETFQWLEEAADFLWRMGVLKGCECEPAATSPAAEKKD